MNESQLAEAVRSALDDATAGMTVRPDIAQRARRQGRRRRALRGLLAGVPAIALAGAGAVFAVHGSGTPAHGSGAPAATPPHMLTAAYVTKQAEAALGQADHYIVQTTQQMPGASVITWSDPVTGNDRQLLKGTGGTTIQWSEPYRSGNYMHWKITVTDTGNRTWYSDTVQASAPMQQEPSSSAVALSPLTSPAQIKEALSSGQVTIAGKGTVNGQAAVDLRLTEKTTQLNYWVNARTYQPVEMVDGKAVIGIAWLPRTGSLVAQANTPQIPAGFRRVSAPAQQ
jgi:hypothetical protein